MARHQFAVIALAAIALTSSLWILLDVITAYNQKTLTFGVPAFETRFDPLRKALPEHTVVGYVSDNNANDTSALAEFYLVQYTLAPVIVRASTDEAQVVGNFHAKPDDAKLRAKNLLIVQDFGNQVYLYRNSAR